MIRQAISCDICGAEKKQAKHWFVAYEHAGELRVSAWNANHRMRTAAKHLCGQTCLHKLVDVFIAGMMSARLPAADAPERNEPAAVADASLISHAAPPSPVPGIAPPVVPVRPLQVVPAAVIIAPSRAVEERPAASLPFDDSPSYASRRWRAEAWERERERCASAPRRKTS